MPRAIAETRPHLSIGTLLDARALVPGAVTYWRWPSLTATVTAHDARIDLEIADGPMQSIPVVPGRRGRDWLFYCPGDCGRRAAKLYELDGRFQCCRCHGLAYQVEPLWRTSAAWCALRLRRQHGLPDILCGPLPPWSRPTDGWRAWREHRAYERTIERIRRYEARLLARLVRFNVELEAQE
jgi:hypothetical protein